MKQITFLKTKQNCHLTSIIIVFLFFSCLSFAGTINNINQKILQIAANYPLGSGYDEKWTGSGTPQEITFKGKTILAASKNGTYCCGFTFAVVMKTAAKEGLLINKTIEDIREFQKQWYGAIPEFEEQQSALALQNLKIGRKIEMENVLPGDFIQFWRKKSGHSAIFIKWILNNKNQKIGFTYLSSQKSTKGVGYQTEYFQNNKDQIGYIDPQRTYFSRLSLTDKQKENILQTSQKNFWGLLTKKHQGIY